MIQVEMPIGSNITDEEMHMIREMGVHWLAVNFLPEDATDEGVTKLQERAARHDLEISNGGAIGVYKNTSIILGHEDREAAMDRYNEFTRILGAHGIKGGYIAWQPNGILRTKVDVGKYTRGGITMIADMEEIDARPILNDREYGEQEIWDNFEWFLERALPVCEETDVKISLHPNDPPAPSLGGAYSLIWRSDDYRRAFKMASDSPYLGMKLCTGCWLEGGEAFGNLMDDIAEFAPQGKIHVVHFRNVSGTMPYFEEVLAEDGYADMFAIAKQLVKYGFDGTIDVDHVFRNPEWAGKDAPSLAGGSVWSAGYATGYMKGLIDAAYKTQEGGC